VPTFCLVPGSTDYTPPINTHIGRCGRKMTADPGKDDLENGRVASKDLSQICL
jgi:hypothetical protein